MTPFWIIQSNGGNEDTCQELTTHLAQMRIPFCQFPFTSFSEVLPEVDHSGPVICQGTVSFVQRIHESRKFRPGAFFDRSRFRYSVWQHHYAGHLLNEGAKVMTLDDLAKSVDVREPIFIRPDDDTKAFNGAVRMLDEVRDLIASCSAHTKVVVGTPQQILEEWRLFIVDGCVSTGTRYGRFLNDGQSTPPADVVDFACARAKDWSPERVFTLDVARIDAGLRLVEVGCLNASGFYRANVQKLVQDVSRFLEEHWGGKA